MSEPAAAYNISPSRAMAAHLIEIASFGKPGFWYHDRVGLRLWAEWFGNNFVYGGDVTDPGMWRVIPGQGFDGCYIPVGDAWQVREGYVVLKLEEVAGPGLAGE